MPRWKVVVVLISVCGVDGDDGVEGRINRWRDVSNLALLVLDSLQSTGMGNSQAGA